MDNAETIDRYSVIIACDIVGESLHSLATACWKQQVPLFFTQTSGLFAYFRIVSPELCSIPLHTR